MSRSSDIRERGIFNGDGEWDRVMTRINREAEEARQRQRAHEQLYLRQFRRPRDLAPFPRPNLRWWICKRYGIHPDSDYEPRPVFRGYRHSHAYRDVVYGARDDEDQPITVPLVIEPTQSVDTTWVLDSETLEGFYDSYEVTQDDPVWEIWGGDPYARIWASVGLILNDDSFRHVSCNSYISF